MMSNFYKPDSTRLPKNTLLHYFRKALMMCVILYTSRIVLHILGVEDYGIFNVVRSVIIMFSFICEKPLILNPWNIDNLVEMELKTGHKAYTIL